MKREHTRRGRLNLAWICLASLLATMAFRLQAQPYDLTWWSVDGGGGTSTGGVYAVTGTIGQPDAGAMRGGNYSLTGGFWSLIAAVQTPEAPFLAISLTPTNTVAISWPSPSAGFGLQQNPDLRTTNWSGVEQSPADNGTTKTVVINPPVGTRFYRLTKS